MRLLDLKDIHELHKAVVAAGLAQMRGALMATIDRQFWERIPVVAVPAEQVLTDLNWMNEAGALADGSIPLRSWLKNALVLGASQVQAATFERVLGALPRESAVQRWRSLKNAWAWPGTLFVVVVVIALLVHVLVKLLPGAWFDGVRDRSWHPSLIFVDFVQLVVVVCIFLRTTVLDKTCLDRSGDADAERSSDCVKQFEERWETLWCVWIFFYAVHVGRELSELLNVWGIGWAKWVVMHGPDVNVITSLLHNHQGLTLAILFWMMIRPTLDDGHKAFRTMKWAYLAWLIAGPFAVLQLALVRTFHVCGMTSAVLVVDIGAGIASGVLAAMCMGLFVGRLESRYLSVATAEFVFLYAYVVIQPLFPLFRVLRSCEPLLHIPAEFQFLPTLSELLLKASACAFKLGIYLVVRRQLKSGRLAFYMKKVRVLRGEIEVAWGEFQAKQRTPRTP
ncbi:MAG: hypothetical protein QM820_03490 [Minicystis sp.]